MSKSDSELIAEFFARGGSVSYSAPYVSKKKKRKLAKKKRAAAKLCIDAPKPARPPKAKTTPSPPPAPQAKKTLTKEEIEQRATKRAMKAYYVQLNLHRPRLEDL